MSLPVVIIQLTKFLDQKLNHDVWRLEDLNGKQIQAAYVHKKM